MFCIFEVSNAVGFLCCSLKFRSIPLNAWWHSFIGNACFFLFILTYDVVLCALFVHCYLESEMVKCQFDVVSFWRLLSQIWTRNPVYYKFIRTSHIYYSECLNESSVVKLKPCQRLSTRKLHALSGLNHRLRLLLITCHLLPHAAAGNLRFKVWRVSSS